MKFVVRNFAGILVVNYPANILLKRLPQLVVLHAKAPEKNFESGSMASLSKEGEDWVIAFPETGAVQTYPSSQIDDAIEGLLYWRDRMPGAEITTRAERAIGAIPILHIVPPRDRDVRLGNIIGPSMLGFPEPSSFEFRIV